MKFPAVRQKTVTFSPPAFLTQNVADDDGEKYTGGGGGLYVNDDARSVVVDCCTDSVISRRVHVCHDTINDRAGEMTINDHEGSEITTNDRGRGLQLSVEARADGTVVNVVLGRRRALFAYKVTSTSGRAYWNSTVQCCEG